MRHLLENLISNTVRFEKIKSYVSNFFAKNFHEYLFENFDFE